MSGLNDNTSTDESSVESDIGKIQPASDDKVTPKTVESSSSSSVTPTSPDKNPDDSHLVKELEMCSVAVSDPTWNVKTAHHIHGNSIFTAMNVHGYVHNNNEIQDFSEMDYQVPYVIHLPGHAKKSSKIDPKKNESESDDAEKEDAFHERMRKKTEFYEKYPSRFISAEDESKKFNSGKIIVSSL